VLDAIEESLPEDAEESEWNWEAITKWANTRWKLNLRDRDLKQAGRDRIGELLIEKAREALEKVDLAEGSRFLELDYGVRTTVAWVHYKFGMELAWEEVREQEAGPLKELILRKADETYDEKETEYPVLAGLSHFTTHDGGQKRYDREKLVAWGRERFGIDLDLEDLRNKQREEIRDLLFEHSRQCQQHAADAMAEAQQQLTQVAESADGNGTLASLSGWLHDKLACDLPADQLARLDRDALELRVFSAIEDHYRPEIRRMERALVLQLLDTAWKDHLLAMDHLRSSVGLRGYAQVDPKVEYKREGMRTFEQMWTAVGERVTDMIFRMEQLDENFVGSTWVDSRAVHDSPPTAISGSDDQQTAIDASQTPVKMEPIRNRQEQVGRNDPCPCGSGKKYKNCCLRKGSLTD
jgi:preprotein translocase subunit SecA